MLVTCYYDIYEKPARFFEYLELFYDLAIRGIPILLFTDPALVPRFRILPATVTVVPLRLADCELYSIGMSYSRELPSGRTPEKDTKAFLSLMNTKIEFIKRAMDHCADETLIWIDYGILKIVKNKERVLQKLGEVNGHVFQKMTLPGCWAFGRSFSVDAIHWRFAGGFFVIPRSYVQRFYDHSKCVLTDFCTKPQYKLTWETNVWTVIEMCAERENIAWFFGTMTIP